MKKLFLLLLLAAAPILAQTTILQIAGENWDGTTLSGHIGPSVTEYGTVNSGTNAKFNGKYYIGYDAPGDSLTFNADVNTDTSDYIIFTHRHNTSNDATNVIDFRNTAGTGYKLIIPGVVGTDTSYQGWYWGNTADHNSTQDLEPYINTILDTALYVYILTENYQRFYKNGGAPLIDTTGLWESTPLKAPTRRRLGMTSAFATDLWIAHISIHKLTPGQSINYTWLNAFGDSLAVFYGLTWTDIDPGLVLEYPSASGLIFQQGDTVNIEWTAGATDSVLLYYSVDNGTNYTLIDTAIATDTVYNWVIPELDYTEEALILITEEDSTSQDVSDNVFTILPASQINILFPVNQTRSFAIGDTAQVKVASILCNDLWFYWSSDSTNWHLIGNAVVDTVNGQYWDTTDYVWTFSAGIVGPNVWLKAEQFADTTIYDTEQGSTFIGNRIPLGSFICQTYVGGALVESRWIYDPSCGWASVTQRYYNTYINDDGLSYARIYNDCESPYTGCNYPRLAQVHLISGGDTTDVYLDAFYTSSSTSVIYKNRTYFYQSQAIYQTDNVNNVTTLVADLTDYFTQSPAWDADDLVLQIYQVQHSKIAGEYLPADTTFENLNDAWFSPLLLVGVNGTPYETVAIELLNTPPIADPALDIAKSYVGSTVTRRMFRGIHPKIIKTKL